ncbi:conserved Plasmodium protein, unknown function [Plasmodium berghei]|uniref:Uncharacterized protein n=1 Tax=Plasmodium berghei TaxID=5821 RepID=A0A0Y9Z5B5_PLABE|nr:conserved Plasmodium protein, unknown function [Plasmodium berghei]
MHKCVDIDSLKDDIITNNSLVSIFNSKDDRSYSSEAYQNNYEKSNIQNSIQYIENKCLNELNIQKRYGDDKYIHYSGRMYKEKTNNFDWNKNKIDVHPNSNYNYNQIYNHNTTIPEYSYQNKLMNYEKSSSYNLSRHFDEINDIILAKKHIKNEYKYNKDIDEDISETNDLIINMINNHYKNLIEDTNKGIKNIANNYDSIFQKINDDGISSSTSSKKNNNLENNNKKQNNAYDNNHINSNNSILHIRNYYTNNQADNYKGNYFDIAACHDIDDCYENDNPYNNNNHNDSISNREYPVYKGTVSNKNDNYIKESETKIILRDNNELYLDNDERKNNYNFSNTNINIENITNSNRNKIYNVFNNMNINKSNHINRGILTFLENKRKNKYSYDSKGIKNDKTDDNNNEDTVDNISNIGGVRKSSNYINNTCLNNNKKYYQDNKNYNLNMKHSFDEDSYYRNIMEKQSMYNNENKKGNWVSEYSFNDIYYKDKRSEKNLKEKFKNKSNGSSCENLKFLDNEDYKNNTYINLLNEEIKFNQTQLNISKKGSHVKMKENNPFNLCYYVKKNHIEIAHDVDHPNSPVNYANSMRTDNFDNHHNVTNYVNNNHNNMDNYIDNCVDDKNGKFDGKNVNSSNVNGKLDISMRFSNTIKVEPEIQSIQIGNCNTYSVNKLKLESINKYQNMYIDNKNTMRNNEICYKKGVINEEHYRTPVILKGIPSSAFEHNEKKQGKINEIRNGNNNKEKHEDFENREKIQIGEELPNDINSSYYATSSDTSTNYLSGSKSKLKELHNCKNMKDINSDNKHILRNKSSSIEHIIPHNNSINDSYSQNKKIKKTHLKPCIDEYIISKDPHNLRNICSNKDNESNNLNLNENYIKSAKKIYNLNSDSYCNNNSSNESYSEKSKNNNYFNDTDNHTPKYSKIRTDRKLQNMHSNNNSNYSDEKKKNKEKCQKNKNKIIKQENQRNDQVKIVDINKNTENLINIDKGNYPIDINRKKNRENQNKKQSNEKAQIENKREINIGRCHEDHIENMNETCHNNIKYVMKTHNNNQNVLVQNYKNLNKVNSINNTNSDNNNSAIYPGIKHDRKNYENIRNCINGNDDDLNNNRNEEDNDIDNNSDDSNGIDCAHMQQNTNHISSSINNNQTAKNMTQCHSSYENNCSKKKIPLINNKKMDVLEIHEQSGEDNNKIKKNKRKEYKIGKHKVNPFDNIVKNKSSKFINILNASCNMRNSDKSINYNYSMDDIKYNKLNIAKEQQHTYSNPCFESNEDENYNCTNQNQINKIHNQSEKKKNSDIYENCSIINNNFKYNDEQNLDCHSSSFNDNEQSKQKKTYDAINPKSTKLNKDQLNENIKNNISRTYPICEAFYGSSNVHKNGMNKGNIISKIKNDTNCGSSNSAYDNDNNNNNNEEDNISIQNETYILTNLKNGKTKKNKEQAQLIKLDQFVKKTNEEIKTNFTQNIVHWEKNKNNAHSNVAVSVYNEKRETKKLFDDHIEDYKKHKIGNEYSNTQTNLFENNPFYLYYNKRSETTNTEIKIQKICPSENRNTQIKKKKKNILNKLWSTVQSENKDNDENDTIPSNNSNINGGKNIFYNLFCKKNKLRKDQKYNDDRIDAMLKNPKQENYANNNDISNDHINERNSNYMNDLNEIGCLAQKFMGTYSCNDNLKSIFQLLRSEIEKTKKEIEYFSKDQKPITFNNLLSNNINHTSNKISDMSKESLKEYVCDQDNSKNIHNIPKDTSNDLIHIKEKQNVQNGNNDYIKTDNMNLVHNDSEKSLKNNVFKFINKSDNFMEHNDKHEHHYQIIKSTHHGLYKNKGSISSSSRRSSISKRRMKNTSAHKDNIDGNGAFNMSNCMLKRVKSDTPYKWRIKKKKGNNDTKEHIIPQINTFIFKHNNNNIYKFKLNNNFLIYDSILLKNKKNGYFFNFNALYKSVFFKEPCNEEKVEYSKILVYKNNMVAYNNQDTIKNSQHINHPNNTLDKGICRETYDTPTNLNDLFIYFR